MISCYKFATNQDLKESAVSTNLEARRKSEQRYLKSWGLSNRKSSLRTSQVTEARRSLLIQILTFLYVKHHLSPGISPEVSFEGKPPIIGAKIEDTQVKYELLRVRAEIFEWPSPILRYTDMIFSRFPLKNVFEFEDAPEDAVDKLYPGKYQ